MRTWSRGVRWAAWALGLWLAAGATAPTAEAGVAARPLGPHERALGADLWPLLALAPGGPVELVVRTDRACDSGDVFAAVTLDLAGGRVELCGTQDASQLRRQILFAIFATLDHRLGWSGQAAWRRLNAWARARLQPWRWQAGNQGPGAHAAPSGARSPAWDLASFAAAWWFERASAAAAVGDLPLTCRLLPQARFIHARLRQLQLGARGAPADTADLVNLANLAAPVCAAYEAWAEPARLDHIEVTLATPSTVTMASMFGHVFLRLVRRSTATAPGALDDPTLAFLV